MNWDAIEHELALWHDTRLELPIWWRDDDAVAPTPELEQLIQSATKAGIPVHLAIIPKGATQALAERVQGEALLIPITHGFAHINHAPQNEKKAEFGDHRPKTDIARDLHQGLGYMSSLFSQNASRLFVPPWNRIGNDAQQVLGTLGVVALSTFTPRTMPRIGRLNIINTHIDPIDWHGTRSCLSENRLCGQLLDMLQARRHGDQDNTEPLGLLTHHLVHDASIWQFVDRFWKTMAKGPIRVWSLQELED